MSSDKETRKLKDSIRQMLWGMAAGRCEKTGCNKLLYESPVTHQTMNDAQIAHNIAHSKKGPRGVEAELHAIGGRDDLSNLLLLCPDCHKEIDSFPERYPVELLQNMKREHEERIRTLTEITSERECITVIYSSSIAKDFGYEGKMEMQEALSKLLYYSSQTHQVEISAIRDNIQDGDSIYTKVRSLQKLFQSRVQPVISREQRPIAVFALAPIPLLVWLGTLFPTGATILPFLKLRYDKWNGLSWRYEMGTVKENPFEVIPPDNISLDHTVALVMETSGNIETSRITAAFPETDNLDIWRIRHNSPDYDLDCSESVVNSWKKTIMNIMNKMRSIYGFKEINIFPAINNALALTLGLARVEKTDAPWIIYDHINGKFVKQIEIIGGNNEI